MYELLTSIIKSKRTYHHVLLILMSYCNLIDKELREVFSSNVGNYIQDACTLQSHNLQLHQSRGNSITTIE